MKATRGKAAWFALVAAGVLLLGVRESVAQLTLQANRADGSVQIVGDATGVNGYSISSPGALLDPAGWSSLTDQGAEGWSEANPRAEQLSELNPLGASDAAGGVGLGAAYAGKTVAPRDEDLSWQYSNTAGEVIDGIIEYAGAINDLVLLVDPDTGAGAIELQSANVGPFDVTGYSIFSEGEALSTAGFTGLGGDWTIANPQSTALANLNLTGSQVFSTGTSLGIGTVWTLGGAQDLSFQFSTAAGDLLPGTVSYGAGLPPMGDDCNMDGVVNIQDANCTPDGQLDAFLAGLTPPSLRGDADGDGEVQFSDFVVLSGNFTNAGQYTDGDFDKDGEVQFSDFVILSGAFGTSGGAVAAAVPEPATGLLALMGIVGLAAMRRVRVRPRMGHLLAACLGLVMVAGATNAVQAQFELDTRLVRIGDNAANVTIDTTREAVGILNGTVTDVEIVEDVTGTVDFLDFAGGPGAFTTDNPYPNGVNDDTMEDFTVQVKGALFIPEGDWTIGINSDDGGGIFMPRVTFVATINENGAQGNPGELIFNGTRGAGTWTVGHFTAPAGGLRTEFEAVMFERGGGDAFEVAHIDLFEDGTVLGANGFELGDTFYGWEQIDGPGPGDFNWDDTVDMMDFTVLSENFGTGTSFAQGDNNGDGAVDLRDFVELVPLLTGTPAGAAAVPEPSSLALILAGGLLLAVRRRRK